MASSIVFTSLRCHSDLKASIPFKEVSTRHVQYMTILHFLKTLAGCFLEHFYPKEQRQTLETHANTIQMKHRTGNWKNSFFERSRNKTKSAYINDLYRFRC